MIGFCGLCVEEKCARMRIFVSDKRERLLKKVLEACNAYYEVFPRFDNNVVIAR